MFPNRKKKTYSLVASLFAAMVMLTGCADTTDDPESTIPNREYTPYGDVAPVADLVNATDFPWLDYIVVNDTHLRINISDTSENPCERTNVDVVETHESVTISLHYGNLPDVDQTLCREPDGIQNFAASEASMMIELDEPLANRTIINGYDGSIGIKRAWSDLDKENLADFPDAMIPEESPEPQKTDPSDHTGENDPDFWLTHPPTDPAEEPTHDPDDGSGGDKVIEDLD